MIELAGLTKSFGARAVLRGVDLGVPAGAVSLLVGANGAGKSTLLRILAGLLAADAGSVRLRGHELAKERRAALSELAFLPQSPRFHPRLTTRQVATYYGRLRGRSSAQVEAELARWDLLGHATVRTAHLSGGLRQRLALAIFSLAAAPVLVLDEPGLSLDPEWRDRLQDYLLQAAANGAAVLVATHLLGEWEGRADVCHLLDDGRIRGELSPEDLRQAFARVRSEAGETERLAP